ncbi:MAG TPA: PQQ-binding-like beta-propeller repeat protein, partial [Gemmataceae bacterium]|nr:PQQ-binding-like beta-propeller repeat protein [Gemmataceae bacterium]
PVVQGGKVLIAPPDAPVLHCLSLRDGRLLWKEDRAADDLYLAGAFGGRVLLVGKQACRALSLADGKLLWRVDTGQPSGHGAAAGGIYYLPVRHDAEAKGPAVLAIDLEKGKVASRVAVAGKEPPGNLLFHEGRVVSQTLDAVTVFPQAKK